MAQPPTADVAELAEVSVLVLGVPGCGKTALINAARGLAPTDPHAAPLEVPPAPGPPELHPDPTQPSLLLWERALVPGAEAWLAEADVVVVASAALFGPQEVAVAAAAREAGKTVIFVRTQADLALHTLRRLLGGGCEAREAALGALRQACTHALHSLGVPASPALFLICSLQPHGLDTPQLRATLLDEAQHCQRYLEGLLRGGGECLWGGGGLLPQRQGPGRGNSPMSHHILSPPDSPSVPPSPAPQIPSCPTLFSPCPILSSPPPIPTAPSPEAMPPPPTGCCAGCCVTLR